ncbi:hypothetical protein PpBr36_02818 [Pyricularia pennisetigena]|uniref:hypothetical protein n=1 Tax=Pyricularia pennisetigena TaxID=1578925 RepID=UPI001152E3AB|nr:hypothetical protein PpBr36_02818 [Pyricularia pennisetigena]TLS30973.1 hypothetical protein PpBr36_02818 [Pyricularia pennisetigena]
MMDLTKMLNNDAAPPSRPQHQQQQQQQQQPQHQTVRQPLTPIQTAAQPPYRDYNQNTPSTAVPTMHMSPDGGYFSHQRPQAQTPGGTPGYAHPQSPYMTQQSVAQTPGGTQMFAQPQSPYLSQPPMPPAAQPRPARQLSFPRNIAPQFNTPSTNPSQSPPMETPAKRKFEADHQPQRPPPSARRKMPRRYTEKPAWARTLDECKNEARARGEEFELKSYNLDLRKIVHPEERHQREKTAERPASRHASPEISRANGSRPGPAPASAPHPTPAAPEVTTIRDWEPSIKGFRPTDPTVKTIADFVVQNVIKNEDMEQILSRKIQFEIEAKLGWVIDKHTDQRLGIPGLDEIVLDGDRIDNAFRSSMTEQQHKGYNEYLNGIVAETFHRNPEAQGRVPVIYKHTREIDRFFELPQELEARLPDIVRRYSRHRVKVRATYVREGPELVPLRQIVKARLADLSIHFPRAAHDCRISINLEMPWEGTIEELERFGIRDRRSPDRNKDRLSYTQGPYQIDLTQVTQEAAGGGMRKEHELEVELSGDRVLQQGQLMMKGARHDYIPLIEGFYNNVQLLAHVGV